MFLLVLSNGIATFPAFAADFSNGQASSIVLGQADFTSGSSNRGGSVSASTLNDLERPVFDSSGNLWVTDVSNHRVLRYDLPISSPNEGGGGPRGDVSPPSFSLDIHTISRTFPENILQTIQTDPFAPIEPVKDATVDLPLVINDNGYAITQYANTIQTNTIDTGDPVNVKLNLDDETGIEHVALYTNLRGDQREIQDSDTYIIFDEYRELEVTDPHEFFSFANVTVYENQTKYSINFNVTFTKPMEKSDIIFRIWDDRRNAADTKIFDAWEVVGSEIVKPTEQEWALVVEKQEESKTQHHPFYDKVNDAIDKWTGYHAESISDEKILDELGLQGSYIPHWIKRIFGQGIHDGELEIIDLKVALEYLQKIGVAN